MNVISMKLEFHSEALITKLCQYEYGVGMRIALKIHFNIQLMHNNNNVILNILFSYGVVLKELSAPAEARKMFIQSISLSPLLWASWRELAKLCEDRTMVSK